MAAKDESTKLANLDEFEVMQFGVARLMEVLKTNLGGDADELGPLDFERIKFPAGTSTEWQVPDVEEGTHGQKKIVGVVLSAQDKRLFWECPFGEGTPGAPPDCVSEDGKIGVPADPDKVAALPEEERYGGLCAACRKSQWGSAEKDNSRAQACNARKHLTLVMPDSLLPRVVSLPPGSLWTWRAYAIQLGGKGLLLTDVVTEATLVMERIGSRDAARAHFRMAGVLSDEAKAGIAEMVETFAGMTRVTAADYQAADA